ncbi:helix-turn-helix domain-containing protein [Paenibacillus piri]|nr:helix-turn-helix domain-containing protein [Paenibacillus piri]
MPYRIQWIRFIRSFMLACRARLQGRYLYRLVWLGMVSACIPVMLAGTVYYTISVHNMYQKNQDESLIALKLIMDRVERILSEIETKSLELSADPLMIDALYTAGFNDKEIARLRLLKLLSRVQNANDFIAGIVYYDIRGQTLLESNYGHLRAEQYPDKQELDAALLSPYSAQWIRGSGLQIGENLTFFHKLPHMKQSDFDGLLVFQLNTQNFNAYLQDNSFHVPDKSLLVLDSEGRQLLSSREEISAEPARPNDDTVLQAVRSDSKSGIFWASDRNGRNQLYSFQKTSSGRTYLSSIPEANISGQLAWIRWAMAWTVGLLLSLGIVLSVITSMRAYSPIQQLIKHGRSLGPTPDGLRNEFGYIHECLNYLHQEGRSLSLYVSQIQPNLRERMFQKLLQKGYPDISILQKDCANLGIPVESHYRVLVATVENIHREKRYLPEDQAILGFSLINIMGELLEQNKSLDGYVVTLHDGSGIAVINSRDLNILVHEPHQYALSVHEAVKKFLKLQVSIGVGNMYTHIADVAVSYQEALIALQNRMFKEPSPVLYTDELDMTKKQTVNLYPAKAEALIIEAVAAGELEKARQALALFAQAVRQTQSYPFVYQSYHLLLSSLIRSVEQRGGSLSQLLEHNLFHPMNRRQTAEELHDWFTDTCFPLLDHMAKQPDSSLTTESRADILHICSYIKDHIYSDISLTQCSEMLGLTPSYVSRLFKKVMGYSFVEYVIHCKMDEAKRLLIQKDISIAEISSMIGYSERNLNRVFQRYTYLSPGQFRARYR